MNFHARLTRLPRNPSNVTLPLLSTSCSCTARLPTRQPSIPPSVQSTTRRLIFVEKMSTPPTSYSAYNSHRNSQSYPPHTPPAPPPKPINSDASSSRRSTPATGPPLPPPPPDAGTYNTPSNQAPRAHPASAPIQDPGPQWLPKILEDKPCVTLPPSHLTAADYLAVGNRTSRTRCPNLIF